MVTGREEDGSKKHQGFDCPPLLRINRLNRRGGQTGGDECGWGEVDRWNLGVAAAGLQVCPWPPASATRRLPPALMQRISGSVRREGHEAWGMWPCRGDAKSRMQMDWELRSGGERSETRGSCEPERRRNECPAPNLNLKR
nr:unnamed protein product [Digitaria exilis]